LKRRKDDHAIVKRATLYLMKEALPLAFHFRVLPLKKGEILLKYHKLKQTNRNMANTDLVNSNAAKNNSIIDNCAILSPLGGKLERGLYKKGIKLTKKIDT